MADASVSGPAEQDARFHFEPRFLAATNTERYMTLDDWVERNAPGASDLLLQMDIEGFEYEVLLATKDSLLQRFRIIVVEFHHLDQLWNRAWFNLAGRVFEKLLQTHICVHLHPNNFLPVHQRRGFGIPRLMEMTFIRRNRLKKHEFAVDFPHPLDFRNTANPEMALPKCWSHPDNWPAGSSRPDMK